MLVHYCHSAFAPWDPLRRPSANVLFRKVSIARALVAYRHLPLSAGWLCARDPCGVQPYGAEERHEGKHTRLTTVLVYWANEEMYDEAGTASRPEREL
jgi:hypothetical protein